MVYDDPLSGSLKRKRRRTGSPAISAQLVFDSGLKGNVGVLPDDVAEELFSHRGEGEKIHAALTTWMPDPTPSNSNWTILSFRRSHKDEAKPTRSVIRFPGSSIGTQSFINIVRSLSPTRTIRPNTAVHILISDVFLLPLETLYVSVDAKALQKLESMQKQYGGGFTNSIGQTMRKAAAKNPSNDRQDGLSQEQSRNELVHQALSDVEVVHTGDLIALQLTHPITHAPAPPAKILACEPVSQGELVSSTRIVIVSASDRGQQQSAGGALLSTRPGEELEEKEDTSNEAFFSATESPARPVVTSKSTTDLSNTDDLFDSTTEGSNLSDDSDDMISLAKPGLTDTPSGISSAVTSATPRPFGSRTGASTPGSVFSNVTASTVRGGQSKRGKIFRAQALLESISDELLHPKPAPDEDEEARVFVDPAALARMGCFSGDWAKIEPATDHSLPSLAVFGSVDPARDPSWRPVKIFTLPDSMSRKPQRYQLHAGRGRKDSISSLAPAANNVATVYMSPILLANLEDVENVSLFPLVLGKRPAHKRSLAPLPSSISWRFPPTATEVTLRKIVSPISNERALNHTIFANLKDHFEQKQRIVKPDDLIAVPIDAILGRSMYEGEAEKDPSENHDQLLRWMKRSKSARLNAVAWFCVEGVTKQPVESDTFDGADVWGGAAAIDPTRMTMRQSGDSRRRIPPTGTNPWPYYLGLQKRQVKSSAGVSGPGELPQAQVSSLRRRLGELISASTSPRATRLGMPPLAVLLTSTQRRIGKAHIVRQICAELGMHHFHIDAFDIVTESGGGFDTQSQGVMEARCARALDCGPENTVICVQHLDALASDRAVTSLKSVLENARVLVATTTDVGKLSDSARSVFTHELEMTAPDESEREMILTSVVGNLGLNLAPDVELSSIAVKTAALVAGDLVDVVERAAVARMTRLESLASTLSQTSHQKVVLNDITLAGGAFANCITSADFETAVDFARKNFADSIGAPKIPNVQWSDVGGLAHVKDAVVETIQLPLSRPELFAKGLKKRSGILFYGPPGTGKTLLAKAIATEFSLNFFSVKGPELLNMYIGESEANVRRVFQRARDARPCVVFFDELDSVAPKRGNQGDSGGVMDRIVSQLLAELDGMSNGEASAGGVFIIGATNRPDLLDQALLRPGRFDKMLYLGISDTHEKQARILQALTRKYAVNPCTLVPMSPALTFCPADLHSIPIFPFTVLQPSYLSHLLAQISMRSAPMRCSKPLRDRREISTRSWRKSTLFGSPTTSMHCPLPTILIITPRKRI